MDTEFQYIDFSLAQWKHRFDFSWFAVTSECWIYWMKVVLKSLRKVDYLFTAVVLKLKKCPKSGHWISVHRLESCTMKASCWLQLVRRYFGMLGIMNESSTKIPWKVDYLFTAVVLKLNKCPKSGYWISVHWFESCTMKASVWLQLVRRDFGMLDTLNESSTKIPWKVEYLFTAVVLKMKMGPKSGYRISVHWFQSCTMKASV